MKKVFLFIIPLTIQVIATIFNFSTMSQGSKVSLLNIVITVCYLVAWICYIIKIKNNEQKALRITMFFWLAVFLASILLFIVNVLDINFSIAVIFVPLLLTPLYGLRVIASTYIRLSILLAIVALSYFAYSAYSLKTLKNKN